MIRKALTLGVIAVLLVAEVAYSAPRGGGGGGGGGRGGFGARGGVARGGYVARGYGGYYGGFGRG